MTYKEIEQSKTFTQHQRNVVYSMCMYQCSINDIATSICLDAYALVSRDKRIYRLKVKKLANQLRDVARDYDHRSVFSLDEKGKLRYADYFDAWQDETKDCLTRLRMCVKNDLDKFNEPSSNALSAALIAHSMADFAFRCAVRTAENIHKDCPRIRVAKQWYVGDRLSRLASDLVDNISPKGCEYEPSAASQAVLEEIGEILKSYKTSERIEKSISEKYKKEKS